MKRFAFSQERYTEWAPFSTPRKQGSKTLTQLLYLLLEGNNNWSELDYRLIARVDHPAFALEALCVQEGR